MKYIYYNDHEILPSGHPTISSNGFLPNRKVSIFNECEN